MSAKINTDLKKISWLDKRFYSADEGQTWQPSVTTILDCYPKGKGLDDWKADLGHNAKYVLKQAGEEGTAVHELIERVLKGERLYLINQWNNPEYKMEVWAMLLKFVEFYQRYKPEVIAFEIAVVSTKYRTAGTIDFICRIAGKVWLIDFKTSNYVHDNYFAQLAAYRQIWNEQCSPETRITHNGILWLKAGTRGEDSTGKKMQGKGWAVVMPTKEHEYSWQIFKHVQALWEHTNPNAKPYILEYPTEVKLY